MQDVESFHRDKKEKKKRLTDDHHRLDSTF